MPRLEFNEGKSSKFWEICLEKNSFTVRYGRLGTSGQTQTKAFASPGKARAEYDRLIAEKLKKGYQPAGGKVSSTPPPPKKSRSPQRSAVLRRDLYCQNDATGFLVTSKKLAARGWEPGSKEWNKAVTAGDIIPVELYQDDSFIARIVVGGELEPQEAEEWTGKLEWKLRVPDGKLLVIGGIEFIIDDIEVAGSEFVEIPRGEYHATIYFYLNSVNGEPCLKEATPGKEPEPIGAYFRRTRGHGNFPAWLRAWCIGDYSNDPGYEEDWTDQKYPSEEERGRFVDFLVHLTPSAGEKSRAVPVLSGFFFSTLAQCRKPEKCPLGLVARDVLNLPVKTPAGFFVTVDVFTHAARFALLRVEGGEAAVPAIHVDRVFRLAWLCNPGVGAEIRLQLPPGAAFSPGEPLEYTRFDVADSSVKIGFGFKSGLGSMLLSVAGAGARLAGLPDGSVIELNTANSNPSANQAALPLGLHRYRGPVRDGVWHITEAFPPINTAALRDALALSAEVEAGNRITGRDADEAARIVQSVKRNMKMYFDENPILIKDQVIHLEKPEPFLLNFIALRTFAARFGKFWRVLDPWEEDEQKPAPT